MSRTEPKIEYSVWNVPVGHFNLDRLPEDEHWLFNEPIRVFSDDTTPLQIQQWFETYGGKVRPIGTSKTVAQTILKARIISYSSYKTIDPADFTQL